MRVLYASELMTAYVQMASAALFLQWVLLGTDHLDFIRPTVTQADHLCYDGRSVQRIQGLFTDSPNTRVVDLLGIFVFLNKSPMIRTSLLAGSFILPVWSRWVKVVTGG